MVQEGIGDQKSEIFYLEKFARPAVTPAVSWQIYSQEINCP